MLLPSDLRRYPPIAVTVDVVVFTELEGSRGVLLIRRGNHPYQGAWALPGGFLEVDEELIDGAVRELAEETGLALDPGALSQLGAYGAVGRDPRGRTVSVVFVALVPGRVCADIRGGDDAAEARVFLLAELDKPGGPELAFDHGDILADARAWVSSFRD